MSELTCEVYGKSVAMERGPDEENFDAVHVDKDNGEIIVCDGMGKRPGSKLAALKVIDYLKGAEAQENGRKVPDDDLWRGPDDTTAAALRPIL